MTLRQLAVIGLFAAAAWLAVIAVAIALVMVLRPWVMA